MLSALERQLSSLSHSEDAINAVRVFCEGLGGTLERLSTWGSINALIRPPIERNKAQELGFDTCADDFRILQGDIVRTDAAYLFGERISQYPKFAALNSSCDLVRGRAHCSMLLPLIELKKSDSGIKDRLGKLAKFSLRDCMFIPAIPGDPADVVGHALHFERVHQIRTDDLHLAVRVASLSLLGWRIFGSFSRMVFTRAGDREVELRQAIDASTSIQPIATELAN